MHNSIFVKWQILFHVICSVSGHVSDKTSFKDVIITYWSLIKELFKDLRYLVADSALCTSDNAKELASQHLYSVTRIPDSYG